MVTIELICRELMHHSAIVVVGGSEPSQVCGCMAVAAKAMPSGHVCALL